MAQAALNLCVSSKVYLKHQVNWNTVCGAIRELPWRNIWLSDVVSPHPRPPVAYSCCVSVFQACNARIEPKTLQLIDETCTSRFSSTAATGWLPEGSVFGPLCSSYIRAKYSSWWKTDHLTLQMTPNYWHLFALLTWTLFRFMSGATTGAWY